MRREKLTETSRANLDVFGTRMKIITSVAQYDVCWLTNGSLYEVRFIRDGMIYTEDLHGEVISRTKLD